MSLTALLPCPRFRPHSVECMWNTTGRDSSLFTMGAAMAPIQSWTQAMSNFIFSPFTRPLAILALQRISLTSMELKKRSWSPQDWSSLPDMILSMSDASTPSGRWTDTPCITSLVLRFPVFMVKTATSWPILTKSWVMYWAYVPSPPTSLGGYSQVKKAMRIYIFIYFLKYISDASFLPRITNCVNFVYLLLEFAETFCGALRRYRVDVQARVELEAGLDAQLGVDAQVHVHLIGKRLHEGIVIGRIGKQPGEPGKHVTRHDREIVPLLICEL